MQRDRPAQASGRPSVQGCRYHARGALRLRARLTRDDRVGDNGEMPAIRANSVLPARREALTLETADGLSLVGELALPPDRDPVATLVCLHPLPTHGGMMDSHVIRKAAFRLPALAGIAVLRFNTRGTASEQGTSEGAFDDAVGERYDVASAIEYAEFHDLPDIWVLGWSFGTDLALMYACDPAVHGAVLLSPPLRFSGARAPRRLGGVRQAADRAGARARRLPAAAGGPRAVRGRAAGRGGRRRRRQAPLGRRRREGARPGRGAGRAVGRRTAAPGVGRPDGDGRHERLRAASERPAGGAGPP